MKQTDRGFWRTAFLIFGLLSVMGYLPVLNGKVPFPRDAVLQFPAWNGTVHSEPWQSYADIGDLITAFYPSRAFAARAVHEGTLPLWNPYLLGGVPFLASPQSSLFYPPNFLYYILPVPVAWTLCLMLRVFLSGIFMTVFARSIGASKSGSIFSGIAFSLCGFMTGWQGQPMDDAAIWLPLMCYAILRLVSADSTRAVAFAAFAFAMPVLAGHPETAAHLTLTAVAFAAVTWSASNFESRFAYRFLAAGLLAGGLASIQMFPTIEWLQQLPKAFDLSWPPQPLHHILAWVSRDATASHNSAGIWIPEGAAYIGMITLIAAPVGLLHRSKRHVWFLGGLTLLSLAIAYGIDPIYSVAAHVPILAGLKNSRMLLLAGFGIAALAGLGISTLEDELPSIPRHRFAALALILISFAVAFLLVYELRLATVTRVELLRRPSFSRALLLVGVIPLLLRLYGKLSRSAFTTAVCAILAFDLLTFSYGYMGFANRDEIFPRAGVFGFLEKNADPAQSRVVQIDGPFPPNANMVYGAASADGYEVRLAALHRAFSFDYMENRMDGFFYTAGRLLRFNDRRLDLMNVRYLVLPATSPEFNRLLSTARFKLAYNNGYVAAFENKTVLPRAFLVAATGVKVLAEVDDQLAVLRADDFDPQRTFTVSDLPQVLKQQPAPQPESGAPLTRNVDTLSSGINGMTLRCTSPERSVLILSQTYYPGWVAEIDGQRTEVFRADITLTGISVPAGVHIVRVAFRPPSFTLGTILTIVSTLFVVVLVRR